MPSAIALSPSHGLKILCFGDSLTSGFHNEGCNFEPYSWTLEWVLRSMGLNCKVVAVGLNGLTAGEMVQRMFDPAIQDVTGAIGKGLGCLLQEKPDMVVIMAGTNDLGRFISPQVTCGELALLHGECHRQGTPTVAIAPSTTSSGPSVAGRTQLASLLTTWTQSASSVKIFRDLADLVPHPSPGPLWEPDDIHLSPAGSRQLGIGLAPLIYQVFQDGLAAQPTRLEPQLASGKVSSRFIGGQKSHPQTTTPSFVQPPPQQPSSSYAPALAQAPAASFVQAPLSQAPSFVQQPQAQSYLPEFKPRRANAGGVSAVGSLTVRGAQPSPRSVSPCHPNRSLSPLRGGSHTAPMPVPSPYRPVHAFSFVAESPSTPATTHTVKQAAQAAQQALHAFQAAAQARSVEINNAAKSNEDAELYERDGSLRTHTPRRSLAERPPLRPRNVSPRVRTEPWFAARTKCSGRLPSVPPSQASTEEGSFSSESSDSSQGPKVKVIERSAPRPSWSEFQQWETISEPHRLTPSSRRINSQRSATPVRTPRLVGEANVVKVESLRPVTPLTPRVVTPRSAPQVTTLPRSLLGRPQAPEHRTAPQQPQPSWVGHF
mmetsp:Transcript_36228/g.96252  ORF Transcript_36228/g.96252 Transcript_36228/m.96252 type:complete len:600 (-) Transcript_36228:184-1983(-)